MTQKTARRLNRKPREPSWTDPAVFGVHSIARAGAPPIRITGNRVFHIERGADTAPLFVSLWRMRSPGYLLAHSLPDHRGGACTATRVADQEDATEALVAYCETLTAAEKDVDPAVMLGAALEAKMYDARIEAFRILVGQALAEWHDWGAQVPFPKDTRST